MLAPVIEKEQINQYHFPHNEVLTSEESRAQRLAMLYKAQTLGNLEKHKVSIAFETLEGVRAVNTTVWAVLDDYVLLKCGTVVPIHAIREVEV
ncbi:hypothetical protein AWR27_14330 [Spirosoma montaniterrae]|uniref:Uncharacterized protein n=2 Tax=Spirosoma montaniterrae TaxID=1178516 RepID=A0A1P9WYD9_9BACT|nr:hypothetical protein AWR27_14330 [Spirosoma montaniterrae]